MRGYPCPQINETATRAPGASDDISQGWEVSSLWVYPATQNAWICLSNARGSAVWGLLTCCGSSFGITPGTGTLTLTGYAPGIIRGTVISPLTGSISIVGYPPSIAQLFNLTPDAGSLALTGYAPSISLIINTTITPGVGSLALTGLAPTLAPTVVVFDSFTGTLDTVLSSHTGEVGATWTIFRDGGNIDLTGDGRVYYKTANPGPFPGYKASGSPTTAEYDVEADFIFKSMIGTAEIDGRIGAGQDTRYLCIYDTTVGSGQWQLYLANGSYTLLGTSNNAYSVGQTIHVKLQIRDASKKIIVDGTTLVTSVDNTLTATGKAGLVLGSVVQSLTTGVQIKNFTVYNA